MSKMINVSVKFLRSNIIYFSKTIFCNYYYGKFDLFTKRKTFLKNDNDKC